MDGTMLVASIANLQVSLTMRRPQSHVSKIGSASNPLGCGFGRKDRDRGLQKLGIRKNCTGLVFDSRRNNVKSLGNARIWILGSGLGEEGSGSIAASMEEEKKGGIGETVVDVVLKKDIITRPKAETKGVFEAAWVMGALALVAFGIGASSASTSSSMGSRRNYTPCFASVSSVLDNAQNAKDQRTDDSVVVVDVEEGKENVESSSGDVKSHKEEVVKDVEVVETDKKKVGAVVNVEEVNVNVSDSDDDDIDKEYAHEDDDDFDEEEEEDDLDGDLDKARYPTLGDLEDLDEFGELGSAAAAAEVLSGSGEIESAETGAARGLSEDPEDEDLDKAYEEWRSKPYALTVPLRIVGLRGSVPPIWLKEFLMSQGKNAKLAVEFKANLSDILAELAFTMEKKQITPKSAMAADLVTVGDSWLATAVQGGLIDPIPNAEQFEWFKRLHPKWQNFLRRDPEGEVNPAGPVWGVPYRWGTLVIAYRRDKVEKIGPIKDWSDLWKPELAGRVAMVDSPREVVGAVLKSLGASYNTKDFDTEVSGGREAVKERFTAFQKQVRLFDDVDYLKAMGAGDVWVAVGWSSDVIPFSKRTSNISVFAPESGTSLWADLWAIPSTTTFARAENVGGRVRGPSPLAFQWLDFCLQPARAATFQNDVFVGASPLYFTETAEPENHKISETSEISTSEEIAKLEKKKEADDSRISMKTNIVEGMPPPDIIAKSEFLEPLSEKALADYQWLMLTPLDVQGWPNDLIEFAKGSFQGLLQWANRQGTRS